MTVWSKVILHTTILSIASIKLLMGQNYEITLPEKLNYGTNRYEVLGTNSDGIVTMNAGKNSHSIALYSYDMKMKWKKPIALKEIGFVNIGKVILTGDSAIVFYTIQARGITFLKAAKVNHQFMLIRSSIVVDTLATSTLLSVPKMSYSVSFLKKRFLIYYDDLNVGERKKMHAYCLDEWLNVNWEISYTATDFMESQIITAEIDDSLHSRFLFGENQVKNFHNDFPFNKNMMVCYNESTQTFSNTITEQYGMIFTEPLLKHDFTNHQLIVAGLYSNSPGNESNGIFINRYSLNGKLLSKKQIQFSTDLLTNLSGNNPPKRNDGFYFFHPSEMIVKKNGGVIFLAESHTVSTESFNSSGYGSFGGSSSLTVNYYHYDEIIACSISDTSGMEWNQVLHKKQQTESDGGIFSSYALVVAPTELILVYNDFSGGTNVLSSFIMKADGKVTRTEIFNADKKGLLPVSKAGQQISPNEIVIPSLKKGYLQYLKLLF